MNQDSRNDIPTKFLILRIWKNLSLRRKKQISFLSITMIASAFSEMLSLASVLPFLTVITNPEKILTYPILSNFLYWANITTIDKIIIFTTLLFVINVSLAAIIRLVNLYLSNFTAASIGSDFGCEAYKRTLYQPYKTHITRNSSVVISSIVTNTERTVDVINFVLLMFTSTLVAVGILLSLIILDWQVATSAGFIFFTQYLILSYLI